MEKTVDRTCYRRSSRMEKQSENGEREKEGPVFHYRLLSLFFNQVIVSLLIILEVLILQYLDKTDILEWIASQMATGPTANELVARWQHKFSNPGSSLYVLEHSGEIFSGENGIKSSPAISGEYLSAVEGVNQMAEDVQNIKEKISLLLPLQGIITSPFGNRESEEPNISTYHTGLDIAAKQGTVICAAHSGSVKQAGPMGSYGNCVMIEEGALVTVYAHCDSLMVIQGQQIAQGEPIAKVGMTGNATGPHLHFEMRYEDRWIDPQKVLDWEP